MIQPSIIIIASEHGDTSTKYITILELDVILEIEIITIYDNELAT